ncbi:MAG: tail fiber domain-containing protein [Opitutales bacterium]|nr:tail fiber domain-containing protein [Opitutales bacterium]
MKTKLFPFASFFAAVLLLTASQASAVPNLMSYQGRVTDAGGTLIGNTSPVNRAVTFRLYTDATGGSAIYAETQSVTISGGEFSVLIGNGTGVSGTPGPSAPATTPFTLYDAINTSEGVPLYLGITVDDGNSATVSAEIAPRQQLVSGAYAFRAGVAEAVASGAVTEAMLGDSSVATGNIQAKAIDSSRIADGGVSTTNIANNAITINKLDTGQIGVWTPNGNNVYRSGNVGIGQSNPGVPLNFANGAGNKISLHGNSGNHYGLGIQSALLQIYTSGSGADVAFGYGSSTSMTETMRIKGTGNVGIGTSAPSAKLHIVGGNATIENTGSPSLTLARGSSRTNLGLAGSSGQWSSSATTNDTVLQAASGKLHLQTGTGSAAVSIDTANRVGIGTSNPTARLDIDGGVLLNGTAGRNYFKDQEKSDGNGLRVGTAWGMYGTYAESGVGVMGGQAGASLQNNSLFVTTGRRVGIGTTNPGYPLEVRGGTTETASYGYLNRNHPIGRVTGTGVYSLRAENRIMAAEFNAVSDARLKTNITPILESDAMDFVNKVSAVKYHWKDGEDKGLKFGFIAQDLVKAGFNNMVGQSADPEMNEEIDASGFTSPAGARFSVNYEMATPILLVAIKQLKKEADLREARIEELEYLKSDITEKDSRITDLETRLAALEELVLSLR